MANQKPCSSNRRVHTLALLTLTVAGAYLFVSGAHAQTTATPETPKIPIPYVTPQTDYKLIEPYASTTPLIFVDPDATQESGIAKLRTFITSISNWLLSILVGLGLIMLVVAGYMFLIAMGNEEKLGKAKKTVQWAIIGMVIAMFAWTLVRVMVIYWPAIPLDEYSGEPGQEE